MAKLRESGDQIELLTVSEELLFGTVSWLTLAGGVSGGCLVLILQDMLGSSYFPNDHEGFSRGSTAGRWVDPKTRAVTGQVNGTRGDVRCFLRLRLCHSLQHSRVVGFPAMPAKFEPLGTASHDCDSDAKLL